MKSTQDIFNDLSNAVYAVNETISAEIALGAIELELHSAKLRIDSPVIFAQLLMQNLHGWAEAGDPEHFHLDEKQFWMVVSEELGPDWLNKFRRVGKFMAEVDNA